LRLQTYAVIDYPSRNLCPAVHSKVHGKLSSLLVAIDLQKPPNEVESRGSVCEAG
jgi:hypothetical protein